MKITYSKPSTKTTFKLNKQNRILFKNIQF